MKTCKSIDPIELQRYYDGELDRAAAGALERHVADCPECQDAVRAFGRLGEAIRRTYVETPSPEMAARLVQRARELRNRASQRIAWELLAAASLLFVSSLLLVFYTQADGAESPTQMARWEELVVSSPVVDEEYPEPDVTSSLYAIHLQRSAVSGHGTE